MAPDTFLYIQLALLAVSGVPIGMFIGWLCRNSLSGKSPAERKNNLSNLGFSLLVWLPLAFSYPVSGGLAIFAGILFMYLGIIFASRRDTTVPPQS
jgi:NhaP-type Na+/H+ or K+/H+ antiporter